MSVFYYVNKYVASCCFLQLPITAGVCAKSRDVRLQAPRMSVVEKIPSAFGGGRWSLSRNGLENK